jgi:cell division transport system permease protein
VGIALALPAALWALLQNVESVSGNVQTAARFTLLLDQSTSFEFATQLAAELEGKEDIDQVETVDRAAALEEFAYGIGLNELMGNLDENPLPHVLHLHPDKNLSSAELDALSRSLSTLESVDQVVFDTQWQARLGAAIATARHLTAGVGVLMVLGAALILGNTIRLGIEARREEITVIKLIGGGDGFARRPLLYSGLWSGAVGGLLGAVLVALLFGFLAGPADELFTLYGSDQRMSGLGFKGTFGLTVAGGLAGLASAWSMVFIHLRRIQPR